MWVGYKVSLRDWEQQEATSFTRSEGMREGAVIEPGEREKRNVTGTLGEGTQPM